MGEKVGYSRVSSQDQSLDRQEDALRGAGCVKVYAEKASGKDRKGRPELRAMLAYIREGDTVVVLSLDRLARSLPDLLAIVEEIGGKGASLVSLKEGIDFATPTGRLQLALFGAMAEFQRAMIREAQAEGVAAAVARGRRLGRPKVERPKGFAQAVAQWRKGERTAVETFRGLGLSKTMFYQLVKELEAEKGRRRAVASSPELFGGQGE